MEKTVTGNRKSVAGKSFSSPVTGYRFPATEN